MSGGSHGFIIGHVTPEAYHGVMLSIIQNNDVVDICTTKNEINLLVPKHILDNRKK